MNIQRFTAATSREALAKARMAFGDSTLILSNRPTENGVEVVATAEDTLAALDQIILIAVTHQLRRPGLARLLDLEETRLPLGEDFLQAGRAAMQIFERCLSATGLVQDQDLTTVSRDLVVMIKALVNAAGQRSDVEEAPLIACVRRAVFGYLRYPAIA